MMVAAMSKALIVFSSDNLPAPLDIFATDLPN